MDSGNDVRERLTRAARASLDAQTADTWLAMLAPGTRLRAVPGPLPAGAVLPRARSQGQGHDQPEGAAAVGWLGGLPCLPASVAWPSWEGHGPLAHIATLDCAQLWPVVPAALRDAGFPDSGSLAFFYFDGSVDGGAEVVGALFAGTADGARVIHIPPGEAAEADPPAAVVPYQKVAVTAEPVLTWATWEHPRLYAAGGRPADGWDEVFAVIDQIRQEQQTPPAHQLGGNPDPVQGPVELEVAYGELSDAGLRKIGWTDPTVISAAEDWLLLGQFDTDSQAGFMWGDCGVLYYLVRPADLAAGRFDQVAFTAQCG